MQDIPLKVLIVDPDSSAAESLQNAFRDIKIVLSVKHVFSLDRINSVIKPEDINTIYIDPISLDIDKASDIIFRIRRNHPGIVFVLYYNSKEQEKKAPRFYNGERRRFHHYFVLDKSLIGQEFMRGVLKTVTACQGDLSLSLTQEKVSRLRAELSSIQENTSNESATVPVKILKEMQDQLSALENHIKGTKAVSITNTPAEFLGPTSSIVKKDRCFVIMPYSETWSAAVEAFLKEICEAEELEFTIAKTMDGAFIPHDIWQGITGAGIIIADLTGGNSNVCYEVGLADAIGRNVVLICQGSSVPFDFSGKRLILYEDSANGVRRLKKHMTERLKAIKKKDLESEIE